MLNCMIGISKHILLDNNDIFKDFKNSVTEQLQNGFVVDSGEKVIPIEVKVEENFRVKSLKMYREKYDSAVCVRTSMANYRNENKGFVNLDFM